MERHSQSNTDIKQRLGEHKIGKEMKATKQKIYKRVREMVKTPRRISNRAPNPKRSGE